MKPIKVFIWNDKPEEAERWQDIIAAGEGIDTVPMSTSLVRTEVLQAFMAAKPDVVVLDIKSRGDTKMGLEIAEDIRNHDLLVPILAVTREPKIVYLATNQYEKLGFAGVFHASVMEPGVFGPIALRPSLNQWHSLVPEFPLTRYCIQQVRAAFADSDSQFEKEFTAMLESLPFSGSMESWHAQIRDPLMRFMERRGLNKLASRFKFMAELFEKADPFYMAGSRSRRHLSHNVQVFLTGLGILLACEPIRQIALKKLRERRDLSDSDGLQDAILIWACIANTHDVAYLCENLAVFTEQLEKVTGIFSTVFPTTGTPSAIPRVNWPALPHGEVAAKLWLADVPVDFEKHYFDDVAAAILRHDSKNFPNSPIAMAHWAQFLAILSDELQDWGRERLNNPPGGQPFESNTWGLFSLERFQVSYVDGFPVNSNKPSWLLALAFVARDHPEIIASRFGTSGEETVRTTFSTIARTLRSNLRSATPFAIELKVDFISRPAAKPVYEPILVSTP
jgi:hypothetical protein